MAGITLERLEKEKIVKGNVPAAPPVSFLDKKFPTSSGRIEFYQERLLQFGEELPIHKEPLESPRTSALARKYPLTFFSVKDRTFTHTQMANVDWMREIEPEPRLDINPLDARRRGIKDAEMVLVFNDRGRVKLKARLTEAFPPGTVNVSHGWWPEQFAEGHYSDLAHRIDDLSIVNPSLDIEPVISDRVAAAHLIYWDCLVEVKKA
jgi:molybdopterin-containing oxidoreductase family molybdopterin binding subunit